MTQSHPATIGHCGLMTRKVFRGSMEMNCGLTRQDVGTAVVIRGSAIDDDTDGALNTKP